MKNNKNFVNKKGQPTLFYLLLVVGKLIEQKGIKAIAKLRKNEEYFDKLSYRAFYLLPSVGTW